MLRIAIPYGLLASRQLRMLAHIARKYDRDYGHFTTRQNIQFNWPKLEDVPDMLADLASVRDALRSRPAATASAMSPPIIWPASRRTRSADPRPWCEIIRQWSTLHPEFTYLPRKFKIAVTGAPTDRAASEVHDIGLHIVRGADGGLGFEMLVGGGLGRTPMIGKVIRRLPAARPTCSATSRRSCASTTATGAATTSTRRASRSW